MINWDNVLIALGQFHFLRPWWLLILPSVLFAIVYLRRNIEVGAQWEQSIAPHLFSAMLVPRKFSSKFNPASMALALLSVCGIILAGPSWQQRSSPFVQDEAVVVVAIDLSYSMDQTDIQPSRIERAKHKVKDLMAKRGGARTGLIVYAGTAHSVIPLTNDPNVIDNFLDALNSTMMPRRGKNPEKVLPIAKAMLDDSGLPGTILLITDGISPSGVENFDDFFATRQDQLLVLGVGTNQQLESNNNKSGAGKLSDTFYPLDTSALNDLVSASQGFYQQITIGDEDVNKLSRRINNHLSTVVDEDRPWLDAGYYLLFPVGLVLLLWFRKGWTIHWCLTVIMLAGTGASPSLQAADLRFADLWMTPDQQGYYHFEQGDFEAAAQRFDDPAWKGLSYYYGENFLAAVEIWSAIETDEGLFNMANAWAQSQNYVYGVQTYKRLLKRNSGFSGAEKNRKFVQDIIDEINRMSESQQAEEGEGSKELGDQPLRSEGVERNDMAASEPKEFTAEQILADKRIQEIWLRQVQRDPSRFLAVKFAMQVQAKEAGGENEE